MREKNMMPTEPPKKRQGEGAASVETKSSALAQRARLMTTEQINDSTRRAISSLKFLAKNRINRQLDFTLRDAVWSKVGSHTAQGKHGTREIVLEQYAALRDEHRRHVESISLALAAMIVRLNEEWPSEPTERQIAFIASEIDAHRGPTDEIAGELARRKATAYATSTAIAQCHKCKITPNSPRLFVLCQQECGALMCDACFCSPRPTIVTPCPGCRKNF
jgi:hypothetical protein